MSVYFNQGQETGGWMTVPEGKPKSAGYGRIIIEEEEEEEKSTVKGSVKLITMDEVAKHNTLKDIWIIINNKVYDTTDYLDVHPGGVNSILINGGADATDDFFAIHSSKANKMLDKWYIGDLDVSSIKKMEAVQEVVRLDPKTGKPLALDPKKKLPFKLQAKTVLSHDSFLLDFALQSSEHVLGLPTGQHVFLSGKVNGDIVMRPYTPISSNHDIGKVQFVIKAYKPSTTFPKGGKFSQYLDSLQIGDTVEMRGPVGEFDYISNGKYFVHSKEHFSSCFNMLAGGTGITPVMQIAAEILRHPEDKTKISMIYGCRMEEDILMRSTLDEWAQQYPDRFKVHYILSNDNPVDWSYSTGYMSKELFQAHLYHADDQVHNLLCGPPLMIEKACLPYLSELGHKESRTFTF
jgi:nitrate reductase (NAD(P)H)